MKENRLGRIQPRIAVLLALWGLALVATGAHVALGAQNPSGGNTVEIRGGHETDPRDMGRPVVLVANGLGVQPEVFREAFSHVHPAPGGEAPDPEQVHRNKDALLSALGRYGITNEGLDLVSNYYRYQPQRGELWTHRDAKVVAEMSHGKVTGFRIVDAGAGYSSAPQITVPGHPEAKAQVTIGFSRDLRKNGAITAVKLVTR